MTSAILATDKSKKSLTVPTQGSYSLFSPRFFFCFLATGGQTSGFQVSFVHQVSAWAENTATLGWLHCCLFLCCNLLLPAIRNDWSSSNAWSSVSICICLLYY